MLFYAFLNLRERSACFPCLLSISEAIARGTEKAKAKASGDVRNPFLNSLCKQV